MASSNSSSIKHATDTTVEGICLKGLLCDGKVVSVHDGDTLKVVIDYRGHLTKFTCRMHGYDSPELKDKGNPDSWIATNTLISECTDLTINVNDVKLTAKEISQLMDGNKKIISVEFLGKEKYGREIVKLHDEQGCINTRLMNHTFNVSYDGHCARPKHI